MKQPKILPIDKKINDLLTEADTLAVNEVERLARNVLKSNPDKLNEFIMCMGSFMLSDKQGNLISNHATEGANLDHLREMKGYKELEMFIYKWDNILKLTGTPMRFTATGKKITDW